MNIKEYIARISQLSPDTVDTNTLQLVEGPVGVDGEQGISTVDVFVSETPPENAIQGTLWINSDTNKLYIYLIENDIGQFVDISGFITPPTINTDNIHRRMWFLNG